MKFANIPAYVIDRVVVASPESDVEATKRGLGSFHERAICALGCGSVST